MRLIDAHDLMERLYDANPKGRVELAELIETEPTVDPVKHGHWVEQEHEDWKWSKECRCSECGKYRLMTNPFGREWNYCPNCGAKMEVEDGVERK